MSEQDDSQTIAFQDLDSGDDAIVIIRSLSDYVALALSLKSDGDLEVSMPHDTARELIEALRRAVDR